MVKYTTLTKKRNEMIKSEFTKAIMGVKPGTVEYKQRLKVVYTQLGKKYFLQETSIYGIVRDILPSKRNINEEIEEIKNGGKVESVDRIVARIIEEKMANIATKEFVKEEIKKEIDRLIDEQNNRNRVDQEDSYNRVGKWKIGFNKR